MCNVLTVNNRTAWEQNSVRRVGPSWISLALPAVRRMSLARLWRQRGCYIAADYDADGRLAGIEILDAVQRLGDAAIFRQVILEDVALGTP